MKVIYFVIFYSLFTGIASAKEPKFYPGCFDYCLIPDKNSTVPNAIFPVRVESEKEHLNCKYLIQKICRGTPEEEAKNKREHEKMLNKAIKHP